MSLKLRGTHETDTATPSDQMIGRMVDNRRDLQL